MMPERGGVLLKLLDSLLPAGLFRLSGSDLMRDFRGFRLNGSSFGRGLRNFRLNGSGFGRGLFHLRRRVRHIVPPKLHTLLNLRRGQAENGGQAAEHGEACRLAAAFPPFLPRSSERTPNTAQPPTKPKRELRDPVRISRYSEQT